MAPSNTSVESLIARIAEHTAVVSQHLKDADLPPVSFETTAQNAMMALPPAIDASRIAAIDAAQELGDLYTGPKDAVISIAYGQSIKPALLRFISSYSIHQLVPRTGSISIAAIAAHTKVHPRAVRHLMSAAISLRLFREETPGEIAHSAASLQMRALPLARDYVWALTEHAYPAIYNMVDNFDAYHTGDAPASSSWVTWKKPRERSWFEYLNNDPARANRFANVMTASHAIPGYDLAYSIDNYAWTNISPGGVVVDMGGSDGRFGQAILEAVPHLRVIVQDLPCIIRHAQQQQHDRPSVGDNASVACLEFMSHDFFREQPISADLYVFRAVLHDWSDEQMAQIMRQLIPALRPDAKVLILDEILPEVGTVGLTAERNQHAMDLAMMAMCSAGSRDIHEWEDAVRAADARYIITRVFQPPDSALGIIELTWKPQTVEAD